MFPDPVRQVVGGALHFSWSGSKWAYGASRVAAWFAASSAVVLFIPVMFENERHQMEEQHLQQQRQVSVFVTFKSENSENKKYAKKYYECL